MKLINYFIQSSFFLNRQICILFNIFGVLFFNQFSLYGVILLFKITD